MATAEHEIIDVETTSTAVAVRERSGVLLMPVMDLQTAKARLQEFQEFCAHYLEESVDGGNDGGDYGVIPGTKKKTLLKSGADKLCELYGLYDEYIIISRVEDWDKGLFDYTLKCVLKSRRDDSMVGAGVGSCSSYESKYRWRESQRKCPHCQQAAIIKGKDFKNDGLPTGWLCFAKKGGCGAKFKDGDKSIEGQALGRVQNDDIIDAKNTVLKMAKKRAKIDAVIGVTRSSGIFTQDMEDIPMPVPTKPAVAVTEEDIPLGAPAVQPGAVSKGTAKAPSSSQPELVPPPKRGPEPAAPAAVKEATVTYCGRSENTSFYAELRKALPGELKSMHEQWGRAWLLEHGYFKMDGDKKVGSLAKCDKALFPELMRDVMKTIADLNARVNTHGVVVTDEDVPF